MASLGLCFLREEEAGHLHYIPGGQRHIIANFQGLNSAPAWSPDGRKLAIVLSKDGNSQIYSVNADGSGLQRITQSSGIDTEPRYSADGSSIYFTSDRGGSPQNLPVGAGGGDAAASPSKAATTYRRARRRMARAWPSSAVARAVSSSP